MVSSRRRRKRWATRPDVNNASNPIFSAEKGPLTGTVSASHNVAVRTMPKRILSVSYDDVLLATRKMLLEQKGYSVMSALGFREAVENCQNDAFDLFVLGHSIPEKDKLHLIGAFRGSCPAPILSLERIGEKQVPCDFHASPDDPAKFLQVVDDILAGREKRSEQKSGSPTNIRTARQPDTSN